MHTENLPAITHVWSSFGHRFLSDGDGYESCLTCGAMYELVRRADDPTGGDYMAANGDDPMPCTGDTGMAHGYPGERFCHEHTEAPGDECVHTAHDCNCLRCA